MLWTLARMLVGCQYKHNTNFEGYILSQEKLNKEKISGLSKILLEFLTTARDYCTRFGWHSSGKTEDMITISFKDERRKANVPRNMALMVKSLLFASSFQSVVNWTSACLPSVEMSILRVVTYTNKNKITISWDEKRWDLQACFNFIKRDELILFIVPSMEKISW